VLRFVTDQNFTALRIGDYSWRPSGGGRPVRAAHPDGGGVVASAAYTLSSAAP